MAEEQVGVGMGAVNAPPQAPKPMKAGQTVCNQRDEKGKLCAGPLKRIPQEGYRSYHEIEGLEVIYRCGKCLTLYQGPPIGHLRDPRMGRFILSTPPDITPPEPAPEKGA